MIKVEFYLFQTKIKYPFLTKVKFFPFQVKINYYPFFTNFQLKKSIIFHKHLTTIKLLLKSNLIDFYKIFGKKNGKSGMI